MVSANRLNDSANKLGAKADRKSAGGLMLNDLDAKAMRACWNTYASFVKANPNAAQSVVTFQVSDTTKTLELESQGGGSAYPHRQFGILASVVAKFEDATIDAAAGEFVDEALELLTPAGQRNAYSNIACKGDSLEVMFGNSERVERLKEIKRTWDPENQFKRFANLL